MTGITDANKFAFTEGELLESSNLIERDVKVFRVGTFTTMTGRTTTWTHGDLDTAVENFRILRDRNILPNVPVRRDHTQSVKDVVGYLAHVRREGDFLLADIEWVDDDAKASYRKQLRNRSLEIGAYTTNDGEKFNPVVLGLAFVDIPAVEGLYRIAEHGETNMPESNEPEITPDPEEVTPEPAAEETPAEVTPEPPAASPAPEVPQPEPVGAHRAQTETFAFRINGVETHDFAAAQAHIDELETFRRETIEGSRTKFVDDLAEGRIITGPQAESFRSLVVTMSPEQFDQFKAGFEGMAPANLFARHDLGETGGAPAATDATADRIAILEGIVANHRYRGATDEEIKKLGSYIELQTLKNATA